MPHQNATKYIDEENRVYYMVRPDGGWGYIVMISLVIYLVSDSI